MSQQFDLIPKNIFIINDNILYILLLLLKVYEKRIKRLL